MQEWHRRKSAGFSIVEMLVIILILMIVAAMAIIQIRGQLPLMRANAAMNRAVAQMRTAREMAVAQRREVQVFFLPPDQIQLQRLNQPAGAPPTTFPPVPFEGGAQFVVFAGVPDTPSAFGNASAIVFGGVTGGPPIMKFRSDGRFVDAAGQPLNGSVFVGLPGHAQTARAVTVLGATGRVRPYRWTGSVWAE